MRMAALFLMFVFSGMFGSIRLAHAVTIDFEGLADSTPVVDQFAAMGLTFADATVLTAGISLNEFEFPPHSGENVVFDDGDAILLAFDAGINVIEVAGFFTYSVPITLTAFDADGNIVDTATSAFSSNLGLSGDLGSTPNEFLSVSFSGGIASVLIEGDSSGSSFTLDDLSFEIQTTPAVICNGIPVTMDCTVNGVANQVCQGNIGDDTIIGTGGSDVIQGLAGQDIIQGLGGNDLICGGNGNDTISGGTGSDFLIGGPGADTLNGGIGDDTLIGKQGDDALNGNQGNDRLFGRLGNDSLNGGLGTDSCNGGADSGDTAINCEGVINLPISLISRKQP